MDKWIEAVLSHSPLDEPSQVYLKGRGVDEDSSIQFYTWKPPETPAPCARFTHHFGAQGQKLKGSLITPIRSPRGSILGFEARRWDKEGSKKVRQYRTDRAEWNPYILGAERAFQSLWDNGDLWIVEGIFDLIALEKVIPSCDAVCTTLRAGMDLSTLPMLSRFYRKASTIYIAYDNDETGRKKGEWLVHKMTTLGMRAVLYKYRGKDPNEVWTQGGERLMRQTFY